MLSGSGGNGGGSCHGKTWRFLVSVPVLSVNLPHTVSKTWKRPIRGSRCSLDFWVDWRCRSINLLIKSMPAARVRVLLLYPYCYCTPVLGAAGIFSLTYETPQPERALG